MLNRLEASCEPRSRCAGGAFSSILVGRRSSGAADTPDDVDCSSFV
ncbi:hypothetical protein RBSWK_00584 [Rhodopirellula baltica SWK14]|uniref:Uncharacterized protein n=1 Tax=Rhodopirellula baltica SWK14 TaxID=993516 RepID=L7CQV4_RHOBT|nr:hypothetical protein RBSWK_00584 [Rhodopirellula baltica SWK14]